MLKHRRLAECLDMEPDGADQGRPKDEREVDDSLSLSGLQSASAALESASRRSSPRSPTQAEKLTAAHPLANELSEKIKGEGCPKLEITPPSNDPNQRSSDASVPRAMHQEKQFVPVPHESSPLDALAPTPDQKITESESKSEGETVGNGVLYSAELPPRSYRHHHAVRRTRRVILRRPILKALLGRQLCETTMPALDLLASGQNLVPIDDQAMAKMANVSKNPVPFPRM